jgi:hypothetical protein
MFYLFPNVKSISSFLNNNLSKYNIEGLLYPCKKLTSIVQSFCDKGGEIDLYRFFNWERDDLYNVTELFEGFDYLSNGFTVRKYVKYEDFIKILAGIEKCTKLTRLTSLFSNCTITGYNNEQITFTKSLGNIKNISYLFENCTSDFNLNIDNEDNSSKGVYTGGALNIGRSFFEKLPNFEVAQRTFADTCLSSPLTYDYFCKRGAMPTNGKIVYLSDDGTNEVELFERVYNQKIINLKECFCNTKFVKCKNWFDPNLNVEVRNYIKTSDGNHSERGYEYYTYSNQNGSYEKYILDNDMFDDCLDNYTDFVQYNDIMNGMSRYKWSNHDLYQDLKYYGNIIGGQKPFEPQNNMNDTIQETYCCLPPDFLYGCSDSEITLDGLFANSNIIGVIPRNLTKKVRKQLLSNIFKNVNIMPNLEYYYNSKDISSEGELSNGLGGILNKIQDVVDIVYDSDSEIINEHYCVVFRDVDGKLKKRKPINSDRNLGQFVYVPSNFTTSGSLVNIFNFRYNLPKHWMMPSKPNDVTVDEYKGTYEFDKAALKLDYHTQYYFITNDCVNWDNVYDARDVFITEDKDIDFSNENILGNYRRYYAKTGDGSSYNINAWTTNEEVSTASYWHNNVNNFHIDLNLCGKKNDYNMIEDYGFPFDIKNKSVILSNFISGILTIFLNGRVFYNSFIANDLTTSKHGSSTIIGYYGFGRNIILPKLNASLSDERISLIPIDNSKLYYDFMIDGDTSERDFSIKNYKDYLIKDKVNDVNNFFKGGYKYEFQ